MTATFAADIIRGCELHKGRAWRECVEGCGAAEANPLRAEVISVSGTPVPVVAALDFALFNRVIGLGIATRATDEQLDETAETYAARGQSNWSVALSPLAEADGDDPVATGALFVSDRIGWLGYAATLPSHRNRGAQGAIMARRIADAAGLGCEVAHTETAAETVDQPNPSYRNMIRAGFKPVCLRPNYSSPTP